MIERIRNLCTIRGINFAKLERELGFANGSIAKTNKGTQAWRLKAIADYFDVSVEFLLTGKDTEKQSVNGTKYYFDDEAAEFADFLHKNPSYRVLFDASRKVKPEDIDFVKQMIDRTTNYDR